jgi:arsenite methyltransferase
MNETVRDEKIKDAVRQNYGNIARRFVDVPANEERIQSSCCGPNRSPDPRQSPDCCGTSQTAEDSPSTECCGSSPTTTECTSAAARFYSTAELSDLPDTVTDASLGCGNPTAIAGLQSGEIVLDLGSGGGIDCFLAAKQVGPEGRVIGLDMTPEMIKLARRNAKKIGIKNVDFRYGEMEDIPLLDESVDAIISNCVINLSPDKDAVFREAYRVLRPGGRMSVSDMVVDGDLPRAIRDKMDAWVGCIAGALDESVYLDKIRSAGFTNIEVISHDFAATDQIAEAEDAQIVVVGPDGQVAEGGRVKALLAESSVSSHQLVNKVASIKVRAYKPA